MWIKCGVDSRTLAWTERGNPRGGATKKREISRSLLYRNLHCSVHSVNPVGHIILIPFLIDERKEREKTD